MRFVFFDVQYEQALGDHTSRDADGQWIVADAQSRARFFQIKGRDRFFGNGFFCSPLVGLG